MTGMPKNKRLNSGAKFGDFIFLEYAHSTHGNMYGYFRCTICEDVRKRVVSQVRTGYIPYCYCQKIKNQKKHGHASNGINTPTYEAWIAMRKRCFSKTHKNYKDYGGRGISICERWMDFCNFLRDMGEKPNGMSIDRIDNSKGYSPDNCRWATISTQNNNKRNNTVLDFNGKSMTISQWSKETGIKDCTISERLRHGWIIEKTLTVKTRKYGCNHEITPPYET